MASTEIISGNTHELRTHEVCMRLIINPQLVILQFAIDPHVREMEKRDMISLPREAREERRRPGD
ncbi:MAG: hypothetical protein E5299_01610 [Burkholderia gladioli]|nr:MAG: hypothetical protein E5299_01610 [Burkholderia gladioli]